MTIQTKPHAKRLTPIITVASGDNRSHVLYVTAQRADELYCAGLLSLIEINGRQEYLLAAAPPALTGRVR